MDEKSHYTSARHSDWIDKSAADHSVGTVGDSFDSAMAESVLGIFKTELHRPAALVGNGGHRWGLGGLEIASCAWVSWFYEG